MLRKVLRKLLPARLRRLLREMQRRRWADYNRIHARQAKSYCDVSGRRVLVVGCNRGGDCRYFVHFGAAEVHGIDVIAGVGAEFHHRRVRYHRCSAEAMPFAAGYFDLVYSVATMEHVPDIERAFSEMARVTAPGGFIYCLAAPLWNSRFGHHKSDIFPDAPWIHLRMSKAEILQYARERGIEPPGGADHHVSYMLNGAFFNKVPARHYVGICASLPGMTAIRNSLDLESPEVLPAEIEDELGRRGYDRNELLAVAHTYVARKA